MRGAPDIEALRQMNQVDLAIEYAERCVAIVALYLNRRLWPFTALYLQKAGLVYDLTAIDNCSGNLTPPKERQALFNAFQGLSSGPLPL
jgi:hypothetical protein